MSDPVVIFGAGASHSLKEIIPNHCGRHDLYPPLTNELFDARFTEIIGSFNLLKEELYRIEHNVKKLGNLEKYLDRLQGRGDDTSRIKLIEIQLYLKRLFEQIQSLFLSDNFRNTSFYYPFIRDIQRYYEKAIFVTFNYDLFLDQAMQDLLGYKFQKISSYTGNPYKLYKVHGSIDWFYLLENHFFQEVHSIGGQVKFIKNFTDSNESRPDPVKVNHHAYLDVDTYKYPAIAIPIFEGKGFIVKGYENELKNHIKNTTKIIVIGWSASDDYFTKIILENADFEKTKLIVVSPKSTQSIIDRLTPEASKEGTGTVRQWKNSIAIESSFSEIVNDLDVLEEIFST